MSAAQNAALPPDEKEVSISQTAEPRYDPLDQFPWLQCEIALQIPALRFTVGDLLSLAPGVVVETLFHHTTDLPLRVNGRLIGWTEFEVIRDRIAVRLTELA